MLRGRMIYLEGTGMNEGATIRGERQFRLWVRENAQIRRLVEVDQGARRVFSLLGQGGLIVGLALFFDSRTIEFEEENLICLNHLELAWDHYGMFASIFLAHLGFRTWIFAEESDIERARGREGKLIIHYLVNTMSGALLLLSCISLMKHIQQ